MSFQYLSEDQRARYRRFLTDPSPEDLERFFYLDAVALAEVGKKRGPHNRLGWAVQWGTVRMLGTFLADPGDVPHVAVEYVAEQLGVADPSCIKNYPERLPTQHEHAREIRGLLGYREFADAEAEVRTFVASRAAQTRDSRRELFDRAVLWLIGGRVLLPGITTLAPLITSVRAEQLAAINDHLVEQTPLEMRRELLGTLVVPEGKKVSPLEWMRTAVAKVSGTGMKEALDRSSAVWAFGAGAVDAGGVAPVKLTELAAYGMHAKAPKIAQLKGTRRVATLLATMRHLEGVSVDDALLLFDLLMATKLLAKANRDEKNAKLKSLPRLRKAALQAESALRAALDTPMTQPGQPAHDEAGPPGAGPVMRVTTAQEMIARIALVVPIEQLEAALAVIREFLPAEQDDADLAWRAELTNRFASVRGFVELLAETVPWGGTDAGTPVIAALRALPRVLAYGKHAGARHIEAHKDLVSGSWRRLVYGNPGLGDRQIDRQAYTFCVLEVLWSALRSKDVYAVGAGRSGDPRARLIPDALWSVHSGSILTALGLDADPGAHLRKLAGDLGEVYRELAGSLDANPAVTIRGGRLSPAKLEAAPLPEAYPVVHDAVMKMLPRIDYPELLLEVHGHTGMFDAFGHISGSTSRRADLDISLAALMVARSCNLGLGPVVKAGDPALGQHRLIGVEKGYFHHEGMGAASGKLIEAQAGIDIAREDWGGGLVASADGLRFVVPVRSLYGRPNPHYFGQSKRSKGATWLAVVSDRVMGLGGLLVPGTMRDSLFILDALHRLDAREQPEILTTDTASYSDIVFGLFAICGYQFAPRISDIGDAQQWWIDPADVGLAGKRTTPSANGYGRLSELDLRRVNIALIKQHWPQMLQVAGSLVTSKVRAYDLIRMMTADGRRTTGLGRAFAHYGRIFKSMHLLHVAHLEDYRRMMGAQLNVGEGRNGLARAVFFANLGQLRRGYERGMEDQLGALGLGLNAIVYWNSLYIDAAVKKLAAGGMKISPEIRAHLSPLQWEHINFHGTYPFNRPELPGRLRDLRDPYADDD